MTRLALLSIACLGVACATTAQGEKPDVPPQAQAEAAPSTFALKADTFLTGAYENERFNGVALVAACDGDILFHEAYGVADRSWDTPLTPDTAFRVASITKQFTAAMTLQLVEEGKIDLDANITTYLPDYPSEVGDIVKIKHLLSNTSGIPNIFLIKGIDDKLLVPVSSKELLGLFSGEPLDFPPGTDYRYSNSNYDILGVIIEELTGMSYPEALNARIVAPLGLTNTGYHSSDLIVPKMAQLYHWDFGRYVPGAYLEPSTVYAAGMLYSTALDLHTFNCALHGGKIVKDAALIEEMITPGDINPHYGYGQHVDTLSFGEKEVRQTGHSGGLPGLGTQDIFLPDEKLSVVVLSNRTPAGAVERGNDLVKLYFGEEVSPLKRSLGDDLAASYRSGGADAIVSDYKEIVATKSDVYDMSENDLNGLGYRIMGRGDVEGAIKVFTLNTEAYPESFNVFDSLGEAYFKAGDYGAAKLNYEASLALNPESTSAPPMLERIESLMAEQ